MVTENADPKIVDRIRKLALSQSSDVHEAAAAAAKAQELIDRHRIDEALLSDERGEERKAIEIVRQVVHTFDGTRAMGWVVQLAGQLAKVNGCDTWYCQLAKVNGCDTWYCSGWRDDTREVRARVECAGTSDAIATVSYLLSYLVAEIDRLARSAVRGRDRERQGCEPCDGAGSVWRDSGREECRSCDGNGWVTVGGRGWGASFRLGAAVEVGNRLWEAHDLTRAQVLADARRTPEQLYAEARAEAERTGDPSRLLELDRKPQGTALVRVEAALARVDEEKDAAKAWVKKNIKLERTTYRGPSDSTAYAEGKLAGGSISLGAEKRLGGGR